MLAVVDESSAPPSPVAKVDYDVENAFDVDVRRLTFDRFRNEAGQLPEEYQSSQEFTAQVAQLCREAGRVFVDTEQTSLEMRETYVPPQISTKIANEKELRQRDAEIQVREEERMQRVNALKGILALVYVWRRPIQLAPTPALLVGGNKVLSQLPEGQTIKPGAVAYMPKFREAIFEDGYLWTAVSMLSTWKEAFEYIFASAEHRDLGMYTYQFYHTDQKDPSIQGWQCVTVDDQIPCSADHVSTIGKTMEDNELWSIMLEKAYAKYLGSYSMLHTGDTWDAIKHLTGGQCQQINWDVEHVNIRSTCYVWFMIQESVKLGLMQSSVFLDRDEDDEGPGDDVRAQRHWGEEVDGEFIEDEFFFEWNATACTVIGCYEFVGSGPNQGLQLVKLRNAFGEIDWQGEWSDQSDVWLKETKEELGYKGPDEYITWMKVDDFVRQYNTLLTVTSFKGASLSWIQVLEPQKEGAMAFHAHQYLITVVDPTAPAAIEADTKKTTTGQRKADLKLEDDPDEEDQAEAPAATFSQIKKGLYDDDEEENKGPTYSLNFVISQPKVDHMSTMPRDMDISIFRQKGRSLQPCTYAEPEYGYGGDEPAQKLVETNRMELGEKKVKSRFEFHRTAAVEPGCYTVTVYQLYNKDRLPYSINFTAEDDPKLPTGYTMKVDYVGTCAHPQLDKEELKKKRKPMNTPRQKVQEKIAKQKAAM